jgi:hypothetical protein
MRNDEKTDSIRHEYQRHGASTQQMASKAYEITEDMFRDGSMTRLVGEYEDEKAADAATRLRKQREASERVLSQILNATADIKRMAEKVIVTDKNMVESINAYTEVLQRTSAIVGDAMTENIWLKTIETASYGMWRAIMGPKSDESKRR